MSGRPWTQDDLDYLRRWHGRRPVRLIAQELNRTRESTYRKTVQLGLSTGKQSRLGKRFLTFLREKHALGWSDAEIAAAFGCERHTVGDWRKRLGLACNALSDHYRRRVARKTRQQLKEAGVSTLAELRAETWRQKAREMGWPEDLRWRSVQILEALHTRGPMTRREIAEAIGMPWKGSRKSLVSNDPEGSYLAHLQARGLVIRLGRVVRGKGSGYSTNLYSLALHVQKAGKEVCFA